MTTYKIGTRGSLLAVTQSTLVKNQLEALSGEKFELVLIKTQGDQITNKPLWQLEGKDFFTKELDEALLKGEVDLVIHSYKDLGSSRPEGIKLAAVTERKFAHDILLIPNEFTKKLKSWDGEFIVGTSSPRRIANIHFALKKYLPAKEDLELRCETLRGNVNSRIKKLKDGQYHAITLALAGLERLAMTEKSAAELKDLFEGLNYFILPQSIFPSAASQGALGIETLAYRTDGGKLEKIISQLAHEKTIEEVVRERKAFKEYGGGCHLAVGIHVRKIGDNFLHVHHGEIDGNRIDKKWLENQTLPKISGKKFIGLPSGTFPAVYDEYLEKVAEEKSLDFSNKHIFVTSRYCLPALKNSNLNSIKGLWAAGTKTAEKLAADGFWINGTSDSLGTEDLIIFKQSKALQLLDPSIQNDWSVLSHETATSELGAVTGCYQRKTKNISSEYQDRLKEVEACYWTSFPEYQAFTEKFPFLKEVKHFCGLGKTWQEFNKAQVSVYPLASIKDFYEL
ncbi:MAG: hydroxymethylbilane synthase [Bacteriovoracaceae bacterium]